MIAELSRDAIIHEAYTWLGTPYVHQASLKGVGADCLGLVRGIWRACVGPEPETAPAYSPDWAERKGAETLAEAARRHFVEKAQPSPGDVILFRMNQDSPAKHAAILTKNATIVHAYWGRGVLESRYSEWWRARAAWFFSFPGAIDWPN